MGPKRSLERVLFSLKSPFLRGTDRYVLGLKCHSSDCNFWLEWFIWIDGTWGTCERSRFVHGSPDRCSLPPKRSLESVVFILKSPFLRGIDRYVLGLQCHQSDCNFWLEWFIWIDGTQGTYPMSRFGDGSHVRCSMGPKKVAGEGIFSLKSPCLRGV